MPGTLCGTITTTFVDAVRSMRTSILHRRTHRPVSSADRRHAGRGDPPPWARARRPRSASSRKSPTAPATPIVAATTPLELGDFDQHAWSHDVRFSVAGTLLEPPPQRGQRCAGRTVPARSWTTGCTWHPGVALRKLVQERKLRARNLPASSCIATAAIGRSSAQQMSARRALLAAPGLVGTDTGCHLVPEELRAAIVLSPACSTNASAGCTLALNR